MNENSPFTRAESDALIAEMNEKRTAARSTVQASIDAGLVFKTGQGWTVLLDSGRQIDGFATATFAWHFGVRNRS